VLASNVANADTPNYQARDFDFSAALRSAVAGSASGDGPTLALKTSSSSPMHIVSGPGAVGNGTPPAVGFRVPEQASMDGNTVDMDRERAAIAQNGMRYETSLRFINSSVRSLLTAIRGD
jgi:flagellar basal-body rod protein FlgB